MNVQSSKPILNSSACFHLCPADDDDDSMKLVMSVHPTSIFSKDSSGQSSLTFFGEGVEVSLIPVSDWNCRGLYYVTLL